jgi:hypothetical protein
VIRSLGLISEGFKSVLDEGTDGSEYSSLIKALELKGLATYTMLDFFLKDEVEGHPTSSV